MRTYANCPWHHRGVCKNMLVESRMREVYGPSMAKEPARYRARYGTEDDLLRYQQTMIDAYCKKWGRDGEWKNPPSTASKLTKRR